MKSKSIITSLLGVTAACLCFASSARASLVSYSPNPADLGDLDHHLVYTWRIDNISVNSPVNVTAATLTIKNIANWDANPNMLFGWLLDTATHPGVYSVQDVDANQVPVVDIVDAFATPITSLVADSTLKTKLFQRSFTTTGQDFVFNFNTSQLQSLTSYINNGHDIAFGFDPDCHYFNDGLTFTMNFTPVPEVGTIVPVISLLAGAIGMEVRRRRRSA